MDEKNEELEKRASEAEKFKQDMDCEIKALQVKVKIIEVSLSFQTVIQSYSSANLTIIWYH